MSRRLIDKAKAILMAERGTIYKDPGGRINICLIYPNTYHVGMSNLGFQAIYGILNKRDDVLCERAFLPDEQDMEEYQRTDTELFSLESQRPIKRFHILCFSVSFENDYPNILKILRLARIPFRAKQRDESFPMIAFGGICAFFNPEPIAEFFDAVFIGEGEEVIEEFLGSYRHGRNRREILKDITGIEGIYVPQFYDVIYNEDKTIRDRIAREGGPQVIKKRWIKDISSHRIVSCIYTPNTEFSNMAVIEAMRGCPWKCRFCVTGYVYKPSRKKDIEALKAEIKDSISSADRVGLVGPSLSDYSDIAEVLNIPGVDFSITSLRASKRSVALVHLLKGRRSVSIAPEAGSKRLRDVIDKRITEEDILETSRTVLEAGIENLRLYFMIGLPTETEDDIIQIVELAKNIRRTSKRGRVTLSISSFVPKPFTPFQWVKMEDVDTLKHRLKLIKSGLRDVGGVRVLHDVPKWAYMQGFLSRGDRQVSYALENMLDNGDWLKVCLNAGIDPAFYAHFGTS